MPGLFFLRLYRRIAATISVLGIAFLVASFTLIWNAASAPGLKSSAPELTVNRFRKGDRLPVATNPALGRELSMPQGLQSAKKVPFGCDPAFSPVASPAERSIYGRCTA